MQLPFTSYPMSSNMREMSFLLNSRKVHHTYPFQQSPGIVVCILVRLNTKHTHTSCKKKKRTKRTSSIHKNSFQDSSAIRRLAITHCNNWSANENIKEGNSAIQTLLGTYWLAGWLAASFFGS